MILILLHKNFLRLAVCRKRQSYKVSIFITDNWPKQCCIANTVHIYIIVVDNIVQLLRQCGQLPGEKVLFYGMKIRS